MHDADAPRWASRPRPVPDAQLDGLAGEAEVSKAWALQLIAGLSLERMALLDIAVLAELGPGLCGGVVGALGSDAELGRLEEGGDLATIASRLGRLTGAEHPAAAAAAVEALRAACWAEVRAALRRPSAELVGAVAERLAFVCARLTQAALGAPGIAPPLAPGEADGVVRARRATAQDERDRPGEWSAAIRRALQGEAGAIVSVLAIDVDEAERLLAADEGGEVGRALARAERILAAALDADGALAVVGPGRYGVALRGLDGPAARAVGERLAGAVAIAGAPGGVPLRASVGLASSPGDGRDAATLVACAEERAVAARATGVTLA